MRSEFSTPLFPLAFLCPIEGADVKEHRTTRANANRLAKYLMEVGFYKEREISFPHKQSNLMKITRDAWEGPHL